MGGSRSERGLTEQPDNAIGGTMEIIGLILGVVFTLSCVGFFVWALSIAPRENRNALLIVLGVITVVMGGISACSHWYLDGKADYGE